MKCNSGREFLTDVTFLQRPYHPQCDEIENRFHVKLFHAMTGTLDSSVRKEQQSIQQDIKKVWCQLTKLLWSYDNPQLQHCSSRVLWNRTQQNVLVSWTVKIDKPNVRKGLVFSLFTIYNHDNHYKIMGMLPGRIRASRESSYNNIALPVIIFATESVYLHR